MTRLISWPLREMTCGPLSSRMTQVLQLRSRIGLRWETRFLRMEMSTALTISYDPGNASPLLAPTNHPTQEAPHSAGHSPIRFQLQPLIGQIVESRTPMIAG